MRLPYLLAAAGVAAFALGCTTTQSSSTPMTFFITSAGSGDGGNLGGLAGADRHCQQIAEAAGSRGHTWRAFLSTQGDGAVNARDRIGRGPWRNARGEVIANSLEELFTQTEGISGTRALTETGAAVNGVGATPNMHDILTGSQDDGRAFPVGEDRTCNNWTSNSTGRAMVGHHDRRGRNDTPASRSWTTAHPSAACDQASLVRTGGNGLFYCFAAD